MGYEYDRALLPLYLPNFHRPQGHTGQHARHTDKITDDPFQVMSSWNDSTNFCKWKGVACSSRLSRVTMLTLPFQKLGGSLSPAIANLTFLRVIDFRDIPPVLGNLSSLLNLSIAQNNLGGIIPRDLGRLSNLQFLQVGNNNLSDNRFFGKVPYDFGRIESLQRLNVGRNLLGGLEANGVEFISSLTNCSKFEFLGIDSNRFSGELPNTVANLSINMNKLLFDGNSLSGKIPSGITNLINLNTLNVSWNEFDSPIISDIGKLFNLRQLYMNGNRFSGNIPISIGNLTKQFELRLDRNKLENSIPSSLGNFFTLLTLTLNLAKNDLTGTLPVEFGNFLNLKEVDLSDNQLLGNIPDSLGRCSSLEHIYMQGNSLNRSIPSTLSALKGIQDFDLSQNNLTGNIPYFLQDFVFLRYLNLSFNHFEGEVPKSGIFAYKSAFSLDGNGKLCGGSIELELPSCSIGSDSMGQGKSNLKVVIGTFIGISRGNLFAFVYKGFLEENQKLIAVKRFGLAKFLRKHAQVQSSSIGIRGSIGYVAPA
ncbi:hypothetical protein BUALT_Bualt01G0048700 [Buddleja alternifolia]|uniref:Leucine-rich repeat-containing N-terminal plant-type domain-containing protein n=1 Tax=Buddleja alternifolia TaxID=168488 RepID=A0AAV6YAJ2_9LAMI|nr:hypothetical protein BUALT_Bualt01G0048700 [Buddleja alternifolia]